MKKNNKKSFAQKKKKIYSWDFLILVQSFNHKVINNSQLTFYDEILFRIQKHPSIIELNFKRLQIPVAAKTKRQL